MNADQGFRRAPENLLRIAAGAGAAVLIAAAISAARRVRTATADRDSGSAQDDSGSAQDQVSLSDVPAPEVPEAVKACDPLISCEYGRVQGKPLPIVRPAASVKVPAPY